MFRVQYTSDSITHQASSLRLPGKPLDFGVSPDSPWFSPPVSFLSVSQGIRKITVSHSHFLAFPLSFASLLPRESFKFPAEGGMNNVFWIWQDAILMNPHKTRPVSTVPVGMLEHRETCSGALQFWQRIHRQLGLTVEAELGPGWFPTLQRMVTHPKVYGQHKGNSTDYQFLIKGHKVGGVGNWGRNWE